MMLMTNVGRLFVTVGETLVIVLCQILVAIGSHRSFEKVNKNEYKREAKFGVGSEYCRYVSVFIYLKLKINKSIVCLIRSSVNAYNA